MVASTVSSKMVEAMAQIEGFRFVDCLTGVNCMIWFLRDAENDS
jgi:phosphomannomutase